MPRRRKSEREYNAENARLIGVWTASANAGSDEAEIERASGCSQADAFRVSALRRAASPHLVLLWREGRLSLRQLQRLALIESPNLSPYSEEEQLELAADINEEIAKLLGRERSSK